MTLSFRKRLQQGDILIGSLLQMPLPEVAESFVQAGYDWLFIDLEHSPMDARNALDILTAVDAKIPCVVRVPWNDEANIKKALDIARCIYARTPQHARTYPQQGYRVIGLCTDYIMLARTAAE
jgi:2-keto-3-deoxy-L-rhamnonate aldolase RhmA